MQLPDLKELDQLIALCRKRGVKFVKIGELELTLSEEPPVSKPRGKAASKAKTLEKSSDPESFDTLSAEEQLFWSSGGAHFDNENKEDEAAN